MKLDLPDFTLECREDDRLIFTWRRYSRIESSVRHCTRLRLLPPGSDGLSQWVFHLRFPEGPTPGLLVVRVDVPADRLQEAQDYTDLLRRRYDIPEQAPDGTEDEELLRVPLDEPGWIAAPASNASEELFTTVMARAASDTA
ncbi:hypothetical protein ACFY5C_24540 [Streptomyces sp. NPDC012935]|uniref:hypothetical protein n=1 Tax=Streptomyces sp. NPDC012935 TaxID=3364857 RepID=UPI0036CC79FF